ncbi:MAG TPA: tRNA-intron lyase [Methanobacteriaceae archaeon]|jgi:tRNA-intron endonuclease|nr:tRNA-intron lyase [Euryarchaeota archaeon]HNR25276.1 tRNA-intron lyase [Methanobacteriaceae archaeon]HNS25036.1 tRNA-intron lyase [Methanobacteriaceae archaeon]
MNGELKGEMVTVTSPKAIRLHENSHFGQLVKDELQLPLVEALFLVEKDKLTLSSKGSDLSWEEFADLLRDEGLFTKYLVYRDLRNRGYIVKTGFKYGSEFRLYERGRSPGNGHSDFLVKILTEDQHININDFSSYVRVAHGVNKKLMLAVVDDEQDITYYNVEWTRP